MAAELAHFTPAERMRGWGAVLGPPDVQGCGFEVDLLPAHVHHFGGPEAVPVGQKHHECVAVAVAVGLGRLDQLLDLVGGQVLARAQLCVGARRGVTVRFSVIGVTTRRFRTSS